MEHKSITQDMLDKMAMPLPAEAVTPHPTKKFLSSIKAIYVTERLNEVFGTGSWKIVANCVEKQDKMVVVKVELSIPEYGIYYECFGGNDNPDLGDAYKGATTDAITKIGSWLGIGKEVFKGEAGKPKPSPITPPHRKVLTMDKLMDGDFADRLIDWLHNRKADSSRPVVDILRDYYEADEETTTNIIKYYNSKYAR